MKAAPLGLALLGAGPIATGVHLPALRRIDGVRVAAVAEADPRRLAAALAQTPGAAGFPGYADALAAPGVEAALICLPNALHASAAVEAFASGLAVYLEKPLAADLAGGTRVVQAWRRSGAVGMVGFNYRFNALAVEARRLLAAGAAGEIVALRTVFAIAAADPPAWKRARASGGGALLDLGSHHFDLARFLTGQEIVSVRAEIDSRRSEEDTALVAARLSGGASLQMLVSLAAGNSDAVEVLGTGGRLAWDRRRSLAVEVDAAGALPGGPGRSAGRLGAALSSPYLRSRLLAPAGEPSFEAALQAFVRAVRAGRQERPDLLDGYRALAAVIAAEASHREGRAVAPAEPPDEDPAGQ
jgi:myo-inositol 2-dehydrogenase/D-chiro-inositol 1-dehydrogenase